VKEAKQYARANCVIRPTHDPTVFAWFQRFVRDDSMRVPTADYLNAALVCEPQELRT
jgi:hypothetical protein